MGNTNAHMPVANPILELELDYDRLQRSERSRRQHAHKSMRGATVTTQCEWDQFAQGYTKETDAYIQKQ